MSTKIEWTQETWNPVTGCTKVSQGCKNCYAERLAPKVFAGQTITTTDRHGINSTRRREFTDVLTHPDRLDAPLHWKKPRRIFVNSMSDLFHEDVPDEFIDEVFKTMGACDDSGLGHAFQILTKRPARMLAYLKTRARDAWNGPRMNRSAFPPRNVWLGVSVEDQATADERIPLLLQTPAAVRFLSCEPLLGPINFRWSKWEPFKRDRPTDELDGLRRLNWIIAGGESGPKARPSHPDWFRSLRDQCAAAGVPFFFKQWGEYGPATLDQKLGEPEPWRLYPDGKRAWSFSELNSGGPWADIVMAKVGKKAAGRTLDGREHSEYPG